MGQVPAHESYERDAPGDVEPDLEGGADFEFGLSSDKGAVSADAARSSSVAAELPDPLSEDEVEADQAASAEVGSLLRRPVTLMRSSPSAPVRMALPRGVRDRIQLLSVDY